MLEIIGLIVMVIFGVKFFLGGLMFIIFNSIFEQKSPFILYVIGLIFVVIGAFLLYTASQHINISIL